MASVRLTDKAVAAAKAEAGKRLELFDLACPGLILRVTDAGRKTWVVRYRTKDGRQPRLTLGTYPALSLVDARDLALDAIKAAAKGGDPSADKKRERTEAKAQPLKTLDDLADAYFTDCRSGDYRARDRKKAESTIVGEEGLYKRHLKARLGFHRLEDLDRDLIKRTLRDLSKVAGIQANRCHSLISQMLNYAVDERQRLKFNPMARLKKPVKEEESTRVLSDVELKAIWQGLGDRTGLKLMEQGKERPLYMSEPVEIALRLLAILLQRRTEVATMELDELDLDQAVWVIPRHKTKNRREHVVPLPDEAVRLIRRAIGIADGALTRRREKAAPGSDLPNRCRFVFPSPRSVDSPIGGGALTHAFADLCAALKIPDASVHDLRRTGSTNMTSKRCGQRRFIVSRVLNHADEDKGAKVTGVYDRNEYLEEKEIALAAWEGLLLEIVGERSRPSNVFEMRM